MTSSSSNNVTITSHRGKTHTVSNTAFRGFGGPQGMLGTEYVVDEIARHLGADPFDIRRRNFYGGKGRNITPYYMTVEDNMAFSLKLAKAPKEYARVAKELAARKIRANAIAPGFIQTKMTDTLPDELKQQMLSNIPLQEFGTPEDGAQAALFFASDASRYVTGQVLTVCGGMVTS